MVEIYWQIQNFMVGHIVPLKVDSHRNNWPMAKIIRVCPEKMVLLGTASYLLVHVMVQNQYWTDQYTIFFTCRGRGRFDSPTRN